MRSALFWLYLVNLVLLILHEMDSAFWREWELFRLPGGIAGFLLLHFPLFLVGAYGLTLVAQGASAGSVLSLVLCAAGLFACGIHTYFLRKGHRQFDTAISKSILWAVLVVSAVQAVVTLTS